MFIEENCEDWILETLRNVKRDAMPAESSPFYGVKNFLIGEVTIDNVGDYAKSSPAVIINVGEDNRVTKQISDRGDTRGMIFVINVYVIAVNKYSRKAGADESRPILRGLRDTLAGLLYNTSAGATEGAARIYYQSQSLEAAMGPKRLYLQQYEIHSLDKNKTRRTL